MAKKNELSKNKLNYFQKRFLRIQKHNIERTDNYIKGFEKRQKALSDSLNKELDIFIKRYADEDKISMKEASKLISKQQRSELKMSLEDFKQKAIEGGHDVELNKIYYTTRVTRLDALQAQLNMLTTESSFNETDELAQHLKDTYKDTYLRNIYELTDRGNVTLTFSTFSEARLQKVLSKDWLGSDFSKRIWKNQTQLLPQQLEKVMARATVTGWSIDRTVKEFKRYTDNVATNRMYTLINTESAHIADESAQEAYRRTGVEKYDWMATFEIHTCPVCADLDGQTFVVDDPLAPRSPKHPNCRCTTVPHLDGLEITERWARDPETGKGTLVDSKTFDEWKKTVADKKPIEKSTTKKANKAKATTSKSANLTSQSKPKNNTKSKAENDPTYIDVTNIKISKIPKTAKEKVQVLIAEAKKNEPQITRDLKQIAKASNTKLEGLDYRLKTAESLERKISKEPDAKMRDIVRYTSISDANSQVDDYNKFVEIMKDKGYTISAVKNYWNNPANPYNGINTNFLSPNNYEFELQFHTQESFDLKNGKLHELYEKQRVLDPVKDVEKYRKLSDEMWTLSRNLIKPNDIEKI